MKQGQNSMSKATLERLIASAPKKPIQPEGHESKCPCGRCEAWANEFIDWQHEMLAEGHNPFARQ